MSILTGCAREEPVTPTDPENSFTIKSKAFGTAVFKSLTTASSRAALQRDKTGEGELSMFGLTTRTAENFTLSMLTKNGAVGSYSIGDGGTGIFKNDIILSIKSISGQEAGTYFATKGTITIIQWDTVGGMAKGSFSGTLVDDGREDTVEISSGVFNLPRVESITK